MNSSSDHDGLLLAVVSHEVQESLAEVVKAGAGVEQLVFVLLVELLDLGFNDFEQEFRVICFHR